MRKRTIVFNCLILLITLHFIYSAVFLFRSSYLRFWETLNDLWNAFMIYVRFIFDDVLPEAPIAENPSEVITVTVLPENISGFSAKFITWFYLLFNNKNFNIWGDKMYDGLNVFADILCMSLPFVILIFFVMKKLYDRVNNKHNQDTIPLRAFKKITKFGYTPVTHFIRDFIEHVKRKKWLLWCWGIIWFFNFNLASIVVASIAYYVYFAVSFDFVGLYNQIGKLFVDLSVVFKAVPIVVWIIIAWLIFCWWRKKTAINRLRHFEARNCGFIKELPIVSITCGSMGKKKTTLITDMTLSQEVMFRQKAFDILQRNDIKFPFFPWICFEKQIQTCIEYGTLYNLATVKEFVRKKQERFKHNQSIYGYDYTKYGIDFDNGLYKENIFDVLETYGQAYFIYILYTSLIVSNYSIATDNEIIDYGNFPMWNMDFFPKSFRKERRYSHILDFDVLRLGKKVLEKNPNAGSFEFGVVTITEIGKERGNNLELQEIKKKAEGTNQKNDLFNAWLKMSRHSATVDNFPFIKIFTDEQRPESWGADARDLCEIVRISKSGEQQLALPFYTIEEMLSEWFFVKVMNFYYELRFKRGDNTLLAYLLKIITAKLFWRNLRIYNRYGYSKLYLDKESGTMTGKPDKRKYYIMNGKIYRKRFSTDCFSDYFNELAKHTNIGLNEYATYLNEKASVDELKLQNSYFIKSLYKDADGK